MENSNKYSEQELLKCPYHSQQYNSQNNVDQKAATQDSGKPDEAGTDPQRYQPDKFEKGTNANSGGEGSTESAADQLNNL